MKNHIPFYLGIFVILTIIVTACGGTSSPQSAAVSTVDSNAPRGYLDSEPSYVLFIQWTEKSGQMSGQLQDVYISSNNSLQTQNANEAFTGTHDGSNVSISTSIFGFTKTFTGSLNGDTLTLVVPNQSGTLNTLTLHPASVDDYNKAATALIDNVNQKAIQATATTDTQNIQAQNAQATATVQGSLDQAVTNANDALRQDFQYLDDDRKLLQQEQDLSSSTNPYQNNIGTMQDALAKEKSDASQGCGDNGYNYSQVGYDESQVSYDKSQIDYDDSGFNQAYQHVSDDVAIVKQRIATAQGDWKTLQAALAADASGPRAAYSQQDVDKEVQSTQTQITTTKGAVDGQANAVAGYDNQAKALDQKAQDIYNAMHC